MSPRLSSRLLLGALAATLASAAADVSAATRDVFLRVQAYDIPAGAMNNPTPIRMWGYVATDAAFVPPAGAVPQVPGPALSAVEGDTLVVHLMNDLTGPFTEPTSVVIPGQTAPMTPVWIDGTGAVVATGARPPGDVTSRVRSFTAETRVGAVSTYTWPSLKAGTYLYESGTHPGVQVQMGLYGALRVYPVAAGRAYGDPSTAFDAEATLLFSEIDPALHDAIAAGTYGPVAPTPAPVTWLSSPIDYFPRFFLVNGKPYAPGQAPIPAGAAGKRLLLRFLNAGLDTKVPTVNGAYISVLAEDGWLATVTTAGGTTIPAPREQWSVLLPAGKTVDALLVPAVAGNVAVWDRRLNLTNAGGTPGGMLTYLAVGAGVVTLQVSPTALGFGSVPRGTTATLPVSISNPGSTGRTLLGATIVASGTNVGLFSVAWTGPIPVPAGGAASLAVSFSPTTTSGATASLRITTDDPAAPTLTVPLSGRGL